jgi:hypothetical protein
VDATTAPVGGRATAAVTTATGHEIVLLKGFGEVVLLSALVRA